MRSFSLKILAEHFFLHHLLLCPLKSNNVITSVIITPSIATNNPCQSSLFVNNRRYTAKKTGHNYQDTDYDYNFILTRFFHCNYFVLNYLIMITLSVYIFRSILISDKLPLLLISSSSDFSAFFFRYTTQRKYCNFIGKFFRKDFNLCYDLALHYVYLCA